MAFVTYPGLTLLELVGPLTTFFGLARGLVMASRDCQTVTVAEHVEHIDSDTPMALIPEKAFEEVPDPFGINLPFGGIDYEHIGGLLAAWRAGVSLAAPVIAAKPKRLSKLTRQRPTNFGELRS